MSSSTSYSRRVVGKVLRVPGWLSDNYHRTMIPVRFHRAMAEFAALPPDRPAPAELLTRIVGLWGNSWAARHEYLNGILTRLSPATGSVLECGSGVSTLLVGIRCRQLGLRMWSLEHHPDWAQRMQEQLIRYDLHDTVTLVQTPLTASDDFEWYDPAPLREAGPFGLVVCDGPPGATPGGRFGLLPRLADRLRPGCLILLDDAGRLGEQVVIDHWADEFGTSSAMFGSEKPYAVVTMPGADGSGHEPV